MGNSTSQTVKDYIVNNVTFQSTVKNALKLDASSSLNSTSTNSFKLVNGDASTCCAYSYTDPNDNKKTVTGTLPNCDGSGAKFLCDIDISQNITGTATLIQKIDSTYITDLTNQLQTTATADLQKKLDQMQEKELFSAAFGDKTRQDVETSVKNAITKTLDQQMVINVVQTAIATQNGKNKGEIYNCGTFGEKGSKCNINQNIGVNLLVSNVLNSIANIVSQNTDIDSFYTKANDALSQAQKGPIGAFFDAIGTVGIVIISIVAGVILLIMLVGIFLLFKGSGGGQMPYYPPPMPSMPMYPTQPQMYSQGMRTF